MSSIPPTPSTPTKSTSKEYNKFKKDYIDLRQYGDIKGAEDLKIKKEEEIKKLQFALKDQGYNLQILINKLENKELSDTKFFTQIQKFNKDVFNPLQAYSPSSISMNPADYKTYNSIKSKKILDADIYTWKGVTITKPNIGSVPTLIELFLNTMTINRTNPKIILPDTFKNVIDFFITNDTIKNRLKNDGVSLSDELKKELTNQNVKITYETKDKNSSGKEVVKREEGKTNRITILDDLLRGSNPIKNIYKISVLDKIEQTDVLKKNLNNIFNKNTIPSNDNLKSIASSITDVLVNNSDPFKDKKNANGKNVIKSNIKDTLSNALITIRDNILSLLNGNSSQSKNFRDHFIRMITTVLNKGKEYKELKDLKFDSLTFTSIKSQPYNLKYILDTSDVSRNYDLLKTIQDSLQKNKIYAGILQKNKDETIKKLESMIKNVNDGQKITQQDIEEISKVDYTIKKDIQERKKETTKKYRDDIESSVKRNIYMGTYEKISAEFIERFNKYKNMKNLIKKQKAMIEQYMKQNTPGTNSIEKKRLKEKEIQKLMKKIADKTRDYLKESGGSVYLETYYDVVRSELMKQKAKIDSLKKKATSTPPTLTPENKKNYQREAPVLVNIYKQFKLITATIATDPTLIKPPQAKPDRLNITLDTTTSNALKDYLNNKDNVSMKALFYNPATDVQRDLARKYGSLYVSFQRTLSTNVSLYDIFRGKIIDNIEKVPAGKMNHLFHIIGFINNDQWNFFPTPSSNETPLDYRKRAILPSFLNTSKYQKEVSREIYKAELVRLRTGFSLGEGIYCKDIYSTTKAITGQRIDNDCQIIINDVAKVQESTNIISLDDFMITTYQNYQELYS